VKVKNCTMTIKQADEDTEKLHTTEFPTNFVFLSDHSGFRRGEIHTLVSPKGAGKSTLIKTLALEMAENGKRVFILLSEETVDQYKLVIFKSALGTFGGNVIKTNEFMSNLFIASELEGEKKTPSELFSTFESILVEYDIDLFIYDNFTTGAFSQQLVSSQGNASIDFKRSLIKYKYSALIVHHAAKGTNVYDSILDGDNVRGNATSVNMGSYNYLLSTFFKENPIRAFLITDKARHHNKANKKVYELSYNTVSGLYSSDRRSDYNVMQQIIIDRKRQGNTKRGEHVDF